MVESSCHSCHGDEGRKRFDYLLWGSVAVMIPAYLVWWLGEEAIQGIPYLPDFTQSVFAIINEMWWGILLGVLFVGLLARVPREFVMKVLGRGRTFGGLVRATLAGVMLDLCSHGILLVGMQLYKRGASLGQVMAFLIASPWNSLTLTLILWSLIGFWWMISFLLLSLVIALITGVIFDGMVKRGALPANPNEKEIPDEFVFFDEAKRQLKEADFTPRWFANMARQGLSESEMVLRWLFFGVVLAALIRTFVSPEMFQDWFGPTLAGLGLTLVAATIIEVCSEGSVPIAADLLTRADAPGNSFAFLMTGVSTDYTEIMSLRETTGSWKISLFLPLVTVPQVVLIAWVMNQF